MFDLTKRTARGRRWMGSAYRVRATMGGAYERAVRATRPFAPHTTKTSYTETLCTSGELPLPWRLRNNPEPGYLAPARERLVGHHPVDLGSDPGRVHERIEPCRYRLACLHPHWTEGRPVRSADARGWCQHTRLFPEQHRRRALHGLFFWQYICGFRYCCSAGFGRGAKPSSRVNIAMNSSPVMVSFFWR